MQLQTGEIGMRGTGGRAPRPLLIVDDDELELCLLADRLGAAGFDVSTAHSGDEARKMLSTGAYPVVISDYQMPGMNGLQLVEQMRARDDRQSYFIMWSIRAAQADREQGFSRGVDDYVSKQSSDVDLLASIEAGFSTVALRQSLLQARAARRQSVVTNVDVGAGIDTDAWRAAASRLHAEILRAQRYQRPLTVLMLHIEEALARPAESRWAPVQLSYLLSAVSSAIRHNVDWAMPLDAASGLTRIMAVFPDTGRTQVAAIRRRLSSVFSELAVTDEFAELMPACSAGIATIDLWSESVAVNAATLVATAERRLEKLAATDC